jgi:hypothetical protein
MMGPTNERASQMISCFLAGVFIVFAFGLFSLVVGEIRDAYSEETQATGAAQSYGSGAGESTLPAARGAGDQGQGVVSTCERGYTISELMVSTGPLCP